MRRAAEAPAFRLSILLSLALCAGCAGAGASGLNYGDNAKLAYSDALMEFYDEDCFEAEPMLRNVRRQFPYSRFAALADLRVADCQFMEGNYAEAIQSYNQFVRYRPSHVEVPYARYMAARANYEQIPSDWLLSPPRYERDQYFAQETLRLLRRFMLDFPEDPLIPPAQRMAEEAIKLLANHEFYVASFYYDRDHPRAAAGRLRTLLRSYPGNEREEEALLLLGDTYVELEERTRARRAFQELLSRFPQGALTSAARARLADLGG